MFDGLGNQFFSPNLHWPFNQCIQMISILYSQKLNSFPRSPWIWTLLISVPYISTCYVPMLNTCVLPLSFWIRDKSIVLALVYPTAAKDRIVILRFLVTHDHFVDSSISFWLVSEQNNTFSQGWHSIYHNRISHISWFLIDFSIFYQYHHQMPLARSLQTAMKLNSKCWIWETHTYRMLYPITLDMSIFPVHHRQILWFLWNQ